MMLSMCARIYGREKNDRVVGRRVVDCKMVVDRTIAAISEFYQLKKKERKRTRREMVES